MTTIPISNVGGNKINHVIPLNGRMGKTLQGKKMVFCVEKGDTFG
jgi:hypothetical protein